MKLQITNYSRYQLTIKGFGCGGETTADVVNATHSVSNSNRGCCGSLARATQAQSQLHHNVEFVRLAVREAFHNCEKSVRPVRPRAAAKTRPRYYLCRRIFYISAHFRRELNSQEFLRLSRHRAGRPPCRGRGRVRQKVHNRSRVSGVHS